MVNLVTKHAHLHRKSLWLFNRELELNTSWEKQVRKEFAHISLKNFFFFRESAHM